MQILLSHITMKEEDFFLYFIVLDDLFYRKKSCLAIMVN